jgi:NAD-dependent deacetylase
VKRIVFLTGAGVSAESGINTFRDSGGLWENYDVMEVASIDGWCKNPGLIQRFYNERRAQLENVKPNEAHKLIAELERDFEVAVVTQNVDDLHERAGSSNVIHLHGELTKACNESKTKIVDIGTKPIEIGSKADDGSMLRPFIVWFGEAVPLMQKASIEVSKADIVVILGTSMRVYPAAGLVDYANSKAQIFLIDPNDVEFAIPKVKIIKEKASVGMALLKNILKETI